MVVHARVLPPGVKRFYSKCGLISGYSVSKTQPILSGLLSGSILNDATQCLVNTNATDRQGETRTLFNLTGSGNQAFLALTLVGLGKKPDSAANVRFVERLRKGMQMGVKLQRGYGLDEIVVDHMGHPKAAAEGATLGLYNYSLKSESNPKDKLPVLSPISGSTDEQRAQWSLGSLYGQSQNLARELADAPSNQMTPTDFCRRVVQETAGLDRVAVRIHDLGAIKDLKMNTFLAVARGSAEEPKLLEIVYEGSERSAVDVALVGKGITFDSGGISIKPSSGMGLMKGDMSGASAVVAATIAAAKLKLPLKIAAVVPLCENMPSGTALKPGDVVVSMSGKTVEVEDTDAEGRLILADALYYAQKIHAPRTIVDVASLTGAMGIAVGPFASGVYATSDALWSRLHQASQVSGDWAWRMPLWEEYHSHLESKIADIRNRGASRDGSANAAAQFLRFFLAGDDQEWAHIDMASVMEAAKGLMSGTRRLTCSE